MSAPAVVKSVGASARASSLTLPMSKTSRTPAESASRSPLWNTQNSRNSFWERSRPFTLSGVTMERHRGRNGRAGWLQRERLSCWTIPPAVSAWKRR